MKRVLLSLFALLAFTAVRAQEPDTLRIKPVSLGVIAEGNLSGAITRVAEISGLSMTPAMGFGVGGFIDYNMNRHLLMKFSLLGTVETSVIRGNGPDTRMMQAGMDIPLYLMGRFGSPRKGLFYFGGGPYTHFTFKAWSPDQADFEDPFRRVVHKDEVTGENKYALNDNNSGLGLILGYEFPMGLQINLTGRYSITNIVNYQSRAGSVVHPYKVSIGLGWRFR